MHLQALGDAGLVVDQAPELHAERIRERIRESGEKDSRVGIRAGEMNGTVKRDDGLPGAGRSRDTSRAAVSALHNPALCRMQKDGPLFPWIFERPFELFHVLHEAEAALCVRVGEWVSVGGCVHRLIRLATGRQLYQCLPCLGPASGRQYRAPNPRQRVVRLPATPGARRNLAARRRRCRRKVPCASHLSHPGCIKNADRSAGTDDGTIFAVRRA